MTNTVSRSYDDHKSPDLPIALYPNRMRKGNGGGHCGQVRVLVYGSRAKGTNRPGSDIDMTITESGDVSPDTLFKLINVFDDSLLPLFR